MSEFGHWVLGGVEAMIVTNRYLADSNRTHVSNPEWPPHATFHDAWTVLLGTVLGASAR
jgi:hypothetical protein